MKKKFRFIGFAFTLSLLWSASLTFGATVNVGKVGLVSDAGVYVAFEKGYFKEQDLDVKLVEFPSAAQMMAPLSTGDLDVATGGIAASTFNGVARGLPIVIVADKGAYLPGRGIGAIVVRKDLWDRGEVRALKDLKGKTIASNATGSINLPQWAKALEMGGLTFKDVDLKFISFPLMVKALETKAIDAANEVEPFVSQAVEKGVAVSLINMDKVVPYMQYAAIFYSKDFVSKKKEAANKFMVAYVKGLREYNDALRQGGERLNAIIDVMVKHTGLKDRKAYRDTIWAGLNPDGYVNKESIVDIQAYFSKTGDVPKTVPIEQMVDNSFVDYAISVLGKYQPR